ncbi:VanZ family protein [Cohnella suwonensis]|uniref:VanZ family protein n=1 Tax=Cohnella suwonensis TaxID=696072 RepID=A0ABW0LQF8_9BACL
MKIKFRWRYVPALACMLTIFFTSSRSGDQLDTVLPWVQKWLPGLADFNPMHYVAYFALGLTFAYAFGAKLSSTWPGAMLNVALCALYGVTDEWHQSYVPMRTPDPSDLLHDAIGAAVAAVLVLIALRNVRGRERGSRNYTGGSGRIS